MSAPVALTGSTDQDDSRPQRRARAMKKKNLSESVNLSEGLSFIDDTLRGVDLLAIDKDSAEELGAVSQA